MNAKLTVLLKTVLADHKRRRKLLMATGGVSLLVVLGVFVSLMVPAISMEQSTPLLEADPATTELGNKLSVKVTAAAQGDADAVYLLSAIGEGGALSSDYVPNERGEVTLEAEDGSEVVLHRVDESKDAETQVSDAEGETASDAADAVEALPGTDVQTSDAEGETVVTETEAAEDPAASEDVASKVDGESELTPDTAEVVEAAQDDAQAQVDAEPEAVEESPAQKDEADASVIEAERFVVDEKQPTDVPAEGERKQLYWLVVPQGKTLSFSADFEATEGAQHKLRLRGMSGASYSEAIMALRTAMEKDDDTAEKLTSGEILDLEWTDPAEAAPGQDDAPAADEPADATDGDAASTADGSADESGDKADNDEDDTPAPIGLSEQTIKAVLDADEGEDEDTPAIDQSAVISIQGMLPKDATASAHPVTADIEGRTVLAAYDITVYYADGSVFQPAKGHPVKVTISSASLQNGDEAIEVYHAGSTKNAKEDAQVTTGDAAGAEGAAAPGATEADDEDGQPEDDDSAAEAPEAVESSDDTYEHVGTAEREDGSSICFYAAHFSPYALAGPLRAPGNPGTITTEDTRSAGITLNLFDYEAYDGAFASAGNSHLGTPNYNTGINSLNGQFRDLRFYPSGISPNNGEPYTINNYTGSDPAALQGVVRSTLDANGYPHTTGFAGLDSNLSYLFDPNEAAGGKTSYADVNHLFTKDASGYYRYVSGWGKKDSSGNMRNGNYAYYDTGQGNRGNFVVYDRTYTNDNQAAPGQRPDASSDSIGFFPFNQYNEDHKTVKLNSQYNHHLGLSMSAAFTIPEGQTVNGNDMVFNFSGDDDMWVFIDEVLVLDIGGVHQPVSGSINFTQGTSTIGQGVRSVTGQNTIGKSKLIADIFADEGKTWDGSEYSKHTIKCFYLERGGCYSDLSLTFNLPIYNSGQIHVTKTVDGPGSANYMDTDFKFKVFIETSEGSNQYAQYTGPVTMDDGTPVSGAGGDGTYVLKSGQGFKIRTHNDRLRYYVQEIDPGGAFSTTINGQATRVENGVVGSPTKPIGDQPETNYKNSVTGVTVSVQKKWYEQDGTTEKTADLPESISLTLHRAWDTTEGGGSTNPTVTKHKVTFRLHSQGESNSIVSSVDDVADGGYLVFYPYAGVKDDGSPNPWSLPRVSVESGSASLHQIGDQYMVWTNVHGYRLDNITSDVTVLLNHDPHYGDNYGDWITTDHTRKDYSVPNVTKYTHAQSGGGTTPPTQGTVVHHDEIVNETGVTNPMTVTGPDWRAEWDGLPMTDGQGNPYTYYVDESTVPAGYEVIYENNGETNGSGSHTGIASGEITVKNKLAYTLPHTGGHGVARMASLGAALAGVAAVLLILRYRRAKEARG